MQYSLMWQVVQADMHSGSNEPPHVHAVKHFLCADECSN